MKILFLEREDKIRRLIGNCFDGFDTSFYGEKLFAFSLSKINRYDVIINFNYSNEFHKKIIIEAKKKGIFTILLHDGIFEWKNSFERNYGRLYYPIYHDLFIYCGDYEQSKIFINKTSKNNILKYVPYYLRNEIVEDDVLPKRGEYQFLITTANNSYFTKDEFFLLSNTINRVVSELENGGFSLCFRIFDSKLAKSIDNFDKYKNIIDCSFQDALFFVESVISTRSSLMVEAIQNNLPVCELVYRDTPQNDICGWKIFECLNNMNSTFLSMLKKDADRMNYQHAFLDNFHSLEFICDENLENLSRHKKISREQLKSMLKVILGK